MEKKELTNRQAVGVGAKIGFICMLLIGVVLSLAFSNPIFAIIPTIITGLPIMFFGIAGAMIGKYWRGTESATRAGAVLGSILGIIGWFWWAGVVGLGQ